MGQEVKNLLRAQSKYGLMGSSAKTGKNNFHESQQQFLDKTVIWDRTPPQLYINCSVYVWGEGSRVPNLQTEFNYLDLFKSYGIFSDFVVPMVPVWSLSFPHHPCRPHIIPASSPLSPHHPHSLQKVPMWSPLSPSSPSSPLSPPMLSPLSPSFPHRLCYPHVVPVILTSSRRYPDHSQPRR